MDPDLEAYLREDLGSGDITTAALDEGQRVEASIVARVPMVVCGLPEAQAVLEHVGARVTLVSEEGAQVAAGTTVLRVEGPAAAVLTGERLALNLLMRMCGIATLTRDLQARIAAVNPRCKVAATRKTTPGFRRFEKRAVETGGGDPHRFGLFDAFLVKDNHLLLVPDIAEVVRRCRALDAKKFLQVEADTPEQALAAARAGADGVLLDNFTPADAARVASEVRAVRPGILIEVSGGITPANVAEYAPAADRISMGFLTHSAPAVDLGLDVTRVS